MVQTTEHTHWGVASWQISNGHEFDISFSYQYVGVTALHHGAFQPSPHLSPCFQQVRMYFTAGCELTSHEFDMVPVRVTEWRHHCQEIVWFMAHTDAKEKLIFRHVFSFRKGMETQKISSFFKETHKVLVNFFVFPWEKKNFGNDKTCLKISFFFKGNTWR